MRLALAVSVLLCLPAFAQEPVPPSEPPVFPSEETPQPVPTPDPAAPIPMEAGSPARTPLPAAPPPAPSQPLPPEEPYVAPTYWQRCFAVPAQAWVAHPHTGRYYVYGSPRLSLTGPLGSVPAAGQGSNFHGATPVGQAPPAKGGSSSGGSASGGSGGGELGKAVLILAVVAVAILPVIVYALDSDAPPVVDARFSCPSFGLDLYGGVDLGSTVAGTGTGRLTFGYGYFGTDLEFSYSGASITSWAGHVLLRIAPRAHIEPNIAFGYRALTLAGEFRHGLEVGVPHRYVFWRGNLRQFALELRPSLLFGLGSLEAALEAALVIPLVEPLHLRAGGRVQSFGETVIGGVNLGLTFTL